MIYLNNAGGQHFVILEPGNLDALKAGKFARTPNNAVIMAYTPDLEWLQEQLIGRVDSLNPEVLEHLLEEGKSRPEKRDRPDFPTYQFLKDGQSQIGKA